MAKRKRHTIRELRELENTWTRKLLFAANKLADYRRRRERALKVDEKSRPRSKTVDQVMATPEPSPAYERTVDALAVSCTTCNVGPGAECLSRGKNSEPHKSRMKRAAEISATAAAKGW